jgi:hypothetical protein
VQKERSIPVESSVWSKARVGVKVEVQMQPFIHGKEMFDRVKEGRRYLFPLVYPLCPLGTQLKEYGASKQSKQSSCHASIDPADSLKKEQ